MEKTFSVINADRVTIWVITDNYYDAVRPDSAFAKRYRSSPGKSIHAEHGLAYFIEVEIEGKKSTCMFDFGIDPAGIINNMDLLGLDIGRVEAFALSHGHFDHWGGSVEILKRNRSGIRKGTSFYIGKEAFLHRYSIRPGRDDAMDLGNLGKSDLEASGVTVSEVAYPMEIIPGGYISGDIERSTPYEIPPRTLLVKREGPPEPDDFRGEQALFFNIKGKGLVIISGCAHAGIVNTVRHIQNISGIQKIHAVMGGFHLINAPAEIIQKTIADINKLRPDIIVPAHCTGFEAVVAFREAMPHEFFLNTAGTQYTFEA